MWRQTDSLGIPYPRAASAGDAKVWPSYRPKIIDYTSRRDLYRGFDHADMARGLRFPFAVARENMGEANVDYLQESEVPQRHG